MKFKVGDKVRVRHEKAMEREFGVNCIGNIKIKQPIYFTPEMRKYCGETVTISEVYDGYYHIEEDNYDNAWTDDMFEGYAFEYGDKIEVSDDNVNWSVRIYLGYIDNLEYPYRVVDEEQFSSTEKMMHSGYRYARPIQKQQEDSKEQTPKQAIDSIIDILNKLKHKL